MARKQDASEFIGLKYNQFTILKDMGIKTGSRFVLAICDCGVEKQVRLADIKIGSSKNCGCVRSKKVSERNLSHGLSRHQLYRTWKGIIERCNYPKHIAYHLYGGRGISVCDLWLNDFLSFYSWALTNGWKPGLQVDRFPDKNGNYSPDNCRITTSRENNRNKSTNHLITFNGKTKCLVEWAEEIGIDQDTLKDRVNKLNWPVEKALSTPLNAHLCS